MPKKVALVGHCGPDSSFLRIAVSRAERDIQVVSVDDDSDLKRLLDEGVDLLLLNRQLDYGFDEDEGVALIRRLRAAYPHVKTMLVSNYPEAQAAAVAEGALPGFGKREIGTPRVGELLREALKPAQPSAAPASPQGKRV
jgi:two-component system, chemotaxis family, chemotaxis protein CheY